MRTWFNTQTKRLSAPQNSNQYPPSIQAEVNDTNGFSHFSGEIYFLLFMCARGGSFGDARVYIHTPLNAQNFPLKRLTLPYLPLTGENVLKQP